MQLFSKDGNLATTLFFLPREAPFFFPLFYPKSEYKERKIFARLTFLRAKQEP